ncbi:MAG: galactitol-1-phosphate 5-dehydrogenase [Eubacterium sp.]|nr:galactitol-1-phosphate 5-dehydrogenase [Eubacterium sp.]
MKAIVMEKVKDLKYVDVDMPTPKDDEVLMQIMAVGVCGSDIPRLLVYGSHVLPIIPGHEFAGKIIEVGKDVEGWKPGDKASAAPLLPCNECEWCKQGIYSLCEGYMYYGSRNDGAYAQYLCVKAANLLRIDADTPYDWGATLDPAANAIHAFLRGNGTGDDICCVYGLGAIGLFAIQYAKVLGCEKIIAVDVNDDKLAVAKECGATFTVNSLKEDPVKAIWDYTEGRGATFTCDMSGFPSAQEQAILSTGKMGRVVFLGISHKGLELSAEAVDNIERYQLSINGSWNSFSNPFPGFEWTEAARLMNEKKFNPELLISHKLLLEELPEVFKKIDARDKSFVYNKIMFYPNGKEEVK